MLYIDTSHLINTRGIHVGDKKRQHAEKEWKNCEGGRKKINRGPHRLSPKSSILQLSPKLVVWGKNSQQKEAQKIL